MARNSDFAYHAMIQERYPVLSEALLFGASAIANAVYHATGKRIRDLLITLDKLL
ncbi:MAG: hypothetical protein RMY34_36165 [Aulosira sp. DedQUE10]|nr:hypothetical protein [Aulosira sp. DedQUE10]